MNYYYIGLGMIYFLAALPLWILIIVFARLVSQFLCKWMSVFGLYHIALAIFIVYICIAFHLTYL